MKALFLDCNDQLAPVWQRVIRAGDPPIDVNRKAFATAELPGVLKGYDIAIDDHSYMPTEFVERCDALKHIVFLGTGPASYMSLADMAARGIKVHIIRNYGDTAVAEHTIALMLAAGLTLLPALLAIVRLSLLVSLSAVASAGLVGIPLGALVALTRFPGRSAVIVILNAINLPAVAFKGTDRVQSQAIRAGILGTPLEEAAAAAATSEETAAQA